MVLLNGAQHAVVPQHTFEDVSCYIAAGVDACRTYGYDGPARTVGTVLATKPAVTSCGLSTPWTSGDEAK
jgi:hypothetical protein